jgi:hypothetical protein
MIRNEIADDSRKVIDKWMDSIADAEMYSESSRGSKGTAINNWNSHRIKIIVLIAYTTHTNKYDKAIPRELARQLSVDLYPDGTSYDFAERDAFHYHIYTLEPLIRAITAIYRATGKNYFAFESDTKSSIKKSVDFMVPYVTGEKTHPEFLNSHVAFDRERAKNGEKGYTVKNFIPSTAAGVLTQAAYFDNSYLAVANSVSRKGDNSWQIVLNKLMKPTGPANKP